jgi:hypothetical protein
LPHQIFLSEYNFILLYFRRKLMNKFATVAAFALLALPFSAHANDHAAEADHAAPAAPAAPAAEAAVAPAEMAAPAVEAKEVTLKDGTKVVIEGEMVSVVAADGAKTPAPDGEHELADGTKVTTKEGKLVPPAPVETPAAAE